MTSAGQRLSERLSEGEVVLIDGGTGTELQARGVPMNAAAWCALANHDRPELVREIHEDYIRAGAEVVIANTFAVTRLLLRGAGMEERFGELSRRAVEAAIAARESTGSPEVAVAGSISLGVAVDFMTRSVPPLSGAALRDACAEQVELLASLGVDILVLEMMMSPSYGAAVVDAALETGLPVWLGISVAVGPGARAIALEDDIGADQLLDELARPELSAVNVMHSSLSATGLGLEAVARHFEGVRGAYPESGDWTPPNWIFSSLTPAEFASAAADWVSEGRVQIIGGCCGTGPPFIDALRRELEARRSG